MSTLSFKRVTKSFSAGGELVRAVDGVSLSVGAGECVALYGPSGSGKTTLLQMAGAILRPDSGTIVFGEHDITALSPRQSARFRREEVGFVFQSLGLIGAATALENAALKLPASGYSLDRAMAMARPWLERVGLGARCDHPARTLSMGERQRVTLARALAGAPKLLLADEPTGNLDSARTRQVLALLREISHEHRLPCVIVTHDAVAHELADRVYTLRDGRLCEGLDKGLDAQPGPAASEPA